MLPERQNIFLIVNLFCLESEKVFPIMLNCKNLCLQQEYDIMLKVEDFWKKHPVEEGEDADVEDKDTKDNEEK